MKADIVGQLRRFLLANPGATVITVVRNFGTKASEPAFAHWLHEEVAAGRLHVRKGCGPRGGKGFFATCQVHGDCRDTPELGRACLHRELLRRVAVWAADVGETPAWTQLQAASGRVVKLEGRVQVKRSWRRTSTGCWSPRRTRTARRPTGPR